MERRWRYTLVVVLMRLTVELDVVGDRKKAGNILNNDAFY